MTNKRILAVDAGFRHTGWALVVDGELCEVGTIHTDKLLRGTDESALAYNARVCVYLADELNNVRRWMQPNVVLIESPTGGSQSSRAASCMSFAIAVVATVFRNCECVWVAPKRTKGKAADAVKLRWPDYVWPQTVRDSEHVFDCLSAFLLWAEPDAAN